MTPRYPVFVALAGICAALCVPSVRAEEAPASAAPAATPPTLEALEVAAPKDWKDQAAVIANQNRVIALIESNTLHTGEEFLRTSNLLTIRQSEYRILRLQYELLLAAAAKGEAGAEQPLAAAYDSLMNRIGRATRFDFNGWSQANPEYAEYEAAPACVTAVWRDPAAARTAAASAVDNAEVKAIVDADQADRKGNWGARSEEERNATMQRDKARNARMREIIAAGDLHTVEDFARAALVMQHSGRFSGYRVAHELAVASMLLGDRRLGRWLVTATYDRMLMSAGLDQRFGTQMGPEGPLRVDESGICDHERIALGCPTLTEARTRQARGSQIVAKELAQLSGPNNTLRDETAGVSAKIPDGWSMSGVTPVGADAKSIPIVNPNHANTVLVLYYSTKPTVIAPEGPEVLLRQHAATKEKERQRRWPDYRNQTDSFVFREINGRPVLSWSATYTEGGQACVEYLNRMFGPTSTGLVFLNSPATQIDALRADADSLVASLQLP
jgi:hypothetical protein